MEKALADLTQAVAQPAAKAWVLYALGMSQVAMGSANDAIVSWERVRQAAPDFEPVYLDLADTYSQVGELTPVACRSSRRGKALAEERGGAERHRRHPGEPGRAG